MSELLQYHPLTGVLGATAALRPLIRKAAASVETERRLSPGLVRALDEVGAFRLQCATELGGKACDPATTLRVIEELCRADGSAGWCAMVGSESSACVNGYLEPETASTILGGGRRDIVALTVVGTGRALRTANGFEVSGRWRFASGCRHSDWLAAMCVVHDAEGPGRRSNGAPLTRILIVRASDAKMHDTWSASGLKGTASDDFELDGIAVADEFSFDLLAPPVDSAPAWRIPVVLRLAMSKAAAVCGMARGAMDALVPMLERTPFAGSRPNSDEPRNQIALAEAEAALEAGRAYLYQNVSKAWETVNRDGQLAIEDIAAVRLAVVWSARSALNALHRMQDIAGTGAVLDPAFDRAARDLEVARHHMQLQSHVLEDVGRVMVGTEPRNPLF